MDTSATNRPKHHPLPQIDHDLHDERWVTSPYVLLAWRTRVRRASRPSQTLEPSPHVLLAWRTRVRGASRPSQTLEPDAT